MSALARRRPPVRMIYAIGAALVVIIGAALWWFVLRDDSPAAFDIDSAAGGVTTTSDPVDEGTAAPEPLDSADGTWVVDPAAGGDVGGTSAGFRIDEELSTVGSTTAVGRTTQVEAEVVIAGDMVTDVEVVVDMGSLATDEPRRDNRMRDALATSEFPTATFVLTEPIVLTSTPLDGETISVAATGDMTIKGVTNPVTVDLDARVVDRTLVVVGSMPVVLADYGVEAPSAPIVLSVADQGTIEFQLFLTKT